MNKEYFYFGGNIDIIPTKENMYDKTTHIFDRISGLVGQIETSLKPPECYKKIAGNFDGQGISYGFIQFALGQNKLQPILTEMITNHYSVFYNIFGILSESMKLMLSQKLENQIEWAKSIQTNNVIKSEWKLKFSALGATKEMQNIQIKHAKERFFKPAQSWMNIYGLQSERGLALLCDISTQNGLIKEYTKELILSQIKPEMNEQNRLEIIANRRAEASSTRWIEDVRTRKLTIAKGFGIIHGIKYDLEKDFCISLDKVII